MLVLVEEIYRVKAHKTKTTRNGTKLFPGALPSDACGGLLVRLLEHQGRRRFVTTVLHKRLSLEPHAVSKDGPQILYQMAPDETEIIEHETHLELTLSRKGINALRAAVGVDMPVKSRNAGNDASADSTNVYTFTPPSETTAKAVTGSRITCLPCTTKSLAATSGTLTAGLLWMELVERAPGYFIQRLTAKDSNGKMPIMQKDFSRAVFQELQDSAPTADRTELHRLDLAVKEISEPLRRLSQRTATNETRTSNLEHQLEQLQADHSTVPIPATTPGSESFATKASLEALSEELGQAVVRIVEVEAVVQRPPAIAAPASETVVLEAASRIDAVESSVKVLQEQMEHGLDLLKLQDLPASSTDEAVQLEELSARVSKALKLAENSGSNMQSLRFDLVVEQDRVAKITEDLNKMSRRLEIAESAFELQAKAQELSDSSVAETAQLASDLPKVHALTERFEASESRTAEALQKMLSSIDKVQMLHKGLEGSNRDLTQLVEGLSSRLDRLEAETRQGEDLQTLLAQAQEAATSSMHEQLSDINSQSGKDSEMLKALQQELERQKAQLADTVSQAQLSESTKDLTRKVEASEATISASMQTLEDQLTEMLSKSKDSVSDIRATVEDALQRVEATEAASKAVREEIMNEEAHGEAHQLARTCQNDLRGVHSDVADLQASLRSLVRRVEDLHHAGTAGDTRKQVSNGARQLELRVEELQKQVMEELEQLAEQQQLLTKVKPGQLVKPEVQDLEQNVERLAAQVAEELQELQMHQGELGKVRVRLQSTDQGKGKAPEVERKISELQHKVLEELEALGKQQEELGKAKVTMADLSDRVQQVVSTVTECKKVTLGMEERLKRLASIEEETPGQSAQALGPLGRGKAELGSDVDDSYGADDFEVEGEVHPARMRPSDQMFLSPRSASVAAAAAVPFRAHRGAQFRQVAASAETCALCRELLELAASGSVIAAERRLHRFAPSSLLGPAEGAMFAAAALPPQFHGAAFRSLLLAAINANDAERAAKFAAGFSKLLPDGSSSMTTQAERESEPLPPSGAEVLGRLLQVEDLTQWLVPVPQIESNQRHEVVALSKALSSSLPVEDAATVRQQALQRLARSPEPLRAELWLRRFEAPWARVQKETCYS
eukprot:s2363_g1.t2